eukprot:SAG31_NODE_1771_length_7309_cov_4.269626_5_plen_233_part_00
MSDQRGALAQMDSRLNDRLLGSVNSKDTAQQSLRQASTVGRVLLGQPPEQQVSKAGCYRWFVVFLMGIAAVLVLWTRTGQSVAIIPWVKECHWSSAEKQMQLSAFFYGYVGSMWLGPILCDRFGGHGAFGAVVFCAVISQALGPLCGCNKDAALAVRVLVGCFEGPFYPIVGFLLCRWFAGSEYSRAQTVMVVGAVCGSLVGFPASSMIVSSSLGWKYAYCEGPTSVFSRQY